MAYEDVDKNNVAQVTEDWGRGGLVNTNSWLPGSCYEGVGWFLWTQTLDLRVLAFLEQLSACQISRMAVPNTKVNNFYPLHKRPPLFTSCCRILPIDWQNSEGR